MDIKSFFSYFIRRKWVIIAAFLLCMVFSGVFTYFGSNTYSSTQSIIIGPQSYASKDGKFVNNIVYVISDLINNESVAAELSKQTGITMDSAALKAMASMTPIEQHQKIDITVSGTDREVVSAVSSKLPGIITGTAGTMFRVDNLIVEGSSSISVDGKSYKKGIISGGVAGIGIGLLVVFVMLMFDDKIRHRRDIENSLGLAYLGAVKIAGQNKQYDKDDLSLLSTKLFINMHDSSSNVIINMNMGNNHDELVYLAGRSLASVNKKVLIIELDPSSKAVNSLVPANHKNGLSDICEDLSRDYNGAIYKTSTENLYVMPYGSGGHLNTATLLDDRFKELMESISERFDMVIINMPGIIGEDKVLAFSNSCGYVVLGISGNSVTMKEVERSVDSIKDAHSNILGYYYLSE